MQLPSGFHQVSKGEQAAMLMNVISGESVEEGRDQCCSLVSPSGSSSTTESYHCELDIGLFVLHTAVQTMAMIDGMNPTFFCLQALTRRPER